MSAANNSSSNDDKSENTQHHHVEQSSSVSSSSLPVTPVGITIARKRINNNNNSKSLKKEEQKQPNNKASDKKRDATPTIRQRKAFRNESSQQSSSDEVPSTITTKSKSSYQKPVSSWSIFWEGLVMYATCVIVPTVIAYILRFHEYQKHHSSSSAAEQQPYLTLLSTTLDLAYALAVEYLWTEPVSETAIYYLCPNSNGPLVAYLGADYMPTWSWCPKPPEPADDEDDLLLAMLSPDAAWKDLRVVAVLSLTLALVRIAIVRAVLGSTNFKDSTRMRALIKCKSSHLLSSNYELTPCGTPVLIRKTVVLDPNNTLIGVMGNDVTVGSSTTSTSTSSSLLARNLNSLQLPFPPSSQAASLKQESRGFVPTIAMRNNGGGVENERGNDDDGDGDDDSVNVGLFLDTSEHGLSASSSIPILSPRPRELSNRDMLPSIPPSAPPLTPARTTTNNTAQSQSSVLLQQEAPDSPLEYLTNSLLRRCNSAGGGVQGGLNNNSSHWRLSPQPQTLRTTTASIPMASSIRAVMPSRRPRHLYAAPRLATAVFRLAYTTAAVVLAYHSFHTANFWPWYVGGAWSSSGSSGGSRSSSRGTAHCWDLNGGAVSVGILDSDFDLRNTVLRRYFLLQASYHFHSTAFHVGSCILLMIQNYRSKDAANPQSPANTSSSSSSIWRVSTTSYLRSLLHHALALLTIATAYIFSSLRRLVAIGMFAFDVSSWFLHVLQICINAKNAKDDDGDDDDEDNNNNKDGRFSLRHLLTATRTIQFFHRFLVLPAFVFCRFGVWGALWYSAWTESRAWLQQLEKTLFPNAALLLQSLWNACMVGLFAANLIHLYRLLYGAPLKRIHCNK